jgi:hypothetical protein
VSEWPDSVYVPDVGARISCPKCGERDLDSRPVQGGGSRRLDRCLKGTDEDLNWLGSLDPSRWTVRRCPPTLNAMPCSATRVPTTAFVSVGKSKGASTRYAYQRSLQLGPTEDPRLSEFARLNFAHVRHARWMREIAPTDLDPP